LFAKFVKIWHEMNLERLEILHLKI